MSERASRRRVGFALLLLSAYALPLLFPPGPAPLGVPTPPEAWLLERILPGVPASWFALRLVALAAGTILLLPLPVAFRRLGARDVPAGRGSALGRLRLAAVIVAVSQALLGPWAGGLGTAAQNAYLVALFAPALLLVWSDRRRDGTAESSGRGLLPVAVLIVLWVGLRLLTDLNSPRATVIVDGWRGWLDTIAFLTQGKNLLTDLYDPLAPGIGATVLFFQGFPLYQAGVLPLSFRSAQVFQIAWIAATAAGLGALARTLMGRGAAAIAVAVFLFSPFTRLIAIFPMVFMLGPLYATAIALCGVAFWRRRSEAALAAGGALTGLALAFPPVVPVVAVFDLFAAWRLRTCWREVWAGGLAAIASFVAAVVPALHSVLRPERVGDVHFRWDGMIQIIDALLLGQLPIRSLSQSQAYIDPRPADIVLAALLAPFAHPRMAVHLLGDVLVDPVGAILLATGIVACACGLRRSPTARMLLLFFLAALAPAFLSPVNVVDIVHAIALPVPMALLAAAGFVALRRRVEWPGSRSVEVVLALAICVGGTLVFDVVNPRILPSSSLGIMLSALGPSDAGRVVVVDYPREFRRDVKQGFYTGPITAFGGRDPVGYVEYEEGQLPVEGFAAEGKDLLFWSVGLEEDFGLASVVCSQWPGATLYEIFDAARVARTHAAHVGSVRWTPALAAERWRLRPCQPRNAAG